MSADRRASLSDVEAQAVGEDLARIYARIAATAMRDVPICNPALQAAAIGFRGFADRAVGIIVTPWFMNLIVAAPPAGNGPHAWPAGASVRLRLPAGDIDFTASTLDGFGGLLSCSLFSPMFDFASMDAARAVAVEALTALFAPSPAADLAPSAKSGARLDRRAFLGGRLGAEERRP
jgi:[NiFe] hydrogenase assembly HybE family chaperone